MDFPKPIRRNKGFPFSVYWTFAPVHTHKEEVSFDTLVKAALRHRPDRIILGEVRGIEARTLLDAMNTGHDGTLTTIHASSPEGALRRMAALAVRATGQITIHDAEEEVRSSIDIVLQLTRCAGQRHVSDILEKYVIRLFARVWTRREQIGPRQNIHVLELGINDLTNSSQMMVIVLGDKQNR